MIWCEPLIERDDVSEELNSVETYICYSGIRFENIVSEELNSVETNLRPADEKVMGGVSEELNSVETRCFAASTPNNLRFQKNLIVWKLHFIKTFQKQP